MIRIVGLSATLPNYRDVGMFLGVNPDTGLFYFDASYRPVPLEMQFVGVSERNILAQKGIMDEVCYQKARDELACLCPPSCCPCLAQVLAAGCMQVPNTPHARAGGGFAAQGPPGDGVRALTEGHRQDRAHASHQSAERWGRRSV